MEEYQNKGIPQGELFNEIYQENLSQQGGPSRAYRERKPFRLTLDKFLFILISLIIIVVIAYIFGYRQGKQLDMDPNRLVSTDEYIVIEDETELTTAVLETTPAEIGAAGKSVTEIILPEVETTAAEVNPGSGETVTSSQETRKWTIQLVTYTSEKYAKNEMDRLRENGYKPFLIPSGKYQQICTNRFSTKEEANKLLEVFKSGSRYRDAFVRKVQK